MDKFSERRLVENELMFRSANRKVLKHVQDEYTSRSIPDTMKLNFYCECSNMHCRDRVKLTVDEYHHSASGRKEFVIIPGHENTAIEKVLREHDSYKVVEKFLDPAKITADIA